MFCYHYTKIAMIVYPLWMYIPSEPFFVLKRWSVSLSYVVKSVSVVILRCVLGIYFVKFFKFTVRLAFLSGLNPSLDQLS